MLEIIIGIAVCVTMAKVADFEDRSPVLWFCITFVLCFLSLYIPLPMLRFIIAGIVAFVAMIVVQMVEDRK